MLEFIILGTLYTNTLTGYDIRKWMEEGIGMFYRASYGSIYPLLGKLEEKGYVICTEEVQGKRMKRKYHITECGKEVFMNWLNENTDCGNSIESFMAKVFFFDLLPSDLAYKKVKEYKERLLDYQRSLIEKKKKYEALENKESYYFKISTLYFGICKLQSIIMWCETVKQGNDLENLIIPMKGGIQ